MFLGLVLSAAIRLGDRLGGAAQPVAWVGQAQRFLVAPSWWVDRAPA